MIALDGKTYNVTIKFTGIPGELHYDSSNMDLILHDGATEGGIRFLNVDNADEKYQAKSEELDGLNHFEPQNKGFLVRRAPGEYVTREIKVNGDNLELDESLGYEGNPTFSLAAEVKSAHKWSGTQTYTKKIVAEGGLEGDVTGDVTGDLTGDSTGKHKGSVDTSDATLVLGVGQVKREWIEGEALDGLVPLGVIVMWSGGLNNIPSGWALCNGANGTPDLRERFIVGAGGAIALNSTGGQETIEGIVTESAGAHIHEAEAAAHALTVEQMPSHSHVVKTGDKGAAGDAAPESGKGGNARQWQTEATGQGQGHTHAVTVESAGAHTHTIDDINVIPPYYALAFIQKVAYVEPA